MDLQYVTDISGRKNSVLLPFDTWKYIQKELEELKILREKMSFFNGLKDAFEEVKLIKTGKKKPNSFDDFINELRSITN